MDPIGAIHGDGRIDSVYAAAAGADAYLTKPVGPAALAATVRRSIPERAG